MFGSAPTTSPADELARLLAGGTRVPVSSAQLAVPVDDLRVHVDGLGTLALPVTPARAEKLRGLAVPAHYGRGEQTLTDPQVRDTWLVPSDLVSVDWGDQLPAVLEAARCALGLSPRCRLAARFHSMLVYEQGQFFLPHQDSVTDDAMLATLVVMLPSAHSGGELVVRDGNGELSYLGSRSQTTCVVFYADRIHEVRPVRAGYRVTLTFTLMVEGSTTGSGCDQPADAALDDLAQLLRRHFTTARHADRTEPLAPPLRLAYLLDHQYTPRGLSWARLKGVDAERAELLGAAAERADCDVVLGLSEVHETWNACETYASSWRSGDGRWPEGAWADGERGGSGEGTYRLNDLVHSEFGLTHWTDPGGTSVDEVRLRIASDEVCASTPSAQLTPCEQDFQGFMGNDGNTLDRWYRRAALVVWPRDLGFANRAQASPSWAVHDLLARCPRATQRDQHEQRDQVRAEVASMMSFWPAAVAAATDPRRLLGEALRLAVLLDDEATAGALLRPFSIETLRSSHVPTLIRLAAARGEPWIVELLREWFGEPARAGHHPGRRDWLTTVASLAPALRRSPGVAEPVLDLAWSSLDELIDSTLTFGTPSVVAQQLVAWAPPLAGLLEATALASAPTVRDRIVTSCRQRLSTNPELTACLIPALRTGATLPDDVRRAAGFGALAGPVADLVRRRLAYPMREVDEWSMALPRGCDCELCARLGSFLAARSQRRLEWPLRQDRRAHVRARIQRAELPVRHQTQRLGSPYTLVLTKAPELFEQEQRARDADRHDLEQLAAAWDSAGETG